MYTGTPLKQACQIYTISIPFKIAIRLDICVQLFLFAILLFEKTQYILIKNVQYTSISLS